ncbi:hypothetical protein AWJ20_1347 [Sugiyamaella lignohabitans]|uniref:Interferon-related developmental regulator N-terminal domain-containing protein n=1 Tax=Sugiyamaella lignohabitans TaxID=796027 RepID=A0A167DMD4_9ASCO|nr:uncharacterized protein AWJ20_1347 [Sugiyamaella lignohabitans]ANB13068.1 hypothetical protein AWJ20_1347 [Sugiyamaella lignohabitans]
MQRRIQLQVDSRRSSRKSSPHTSRPSSAQASRSSSRIGARIQAGDEDEADEYTSNAFLSPSLTASGGPDTLTESLDKLLLSSSEDDDDESKEHTHKDKFSEGVEMLSLDRRNTSLEAREKALIDILSIISQKYEPEKVTQPLCDVLTKAFMTSRSELETLLSIQAIVVAAAVDVDLFFETLNDDVLPKLFRQIRSSDETSFTATCRANLTIGYALLQYIVHYGSGGFKVDDIIETLVDLAAECNTAEETAIAGAAILGSGLLATTLPSPNSTIDEYMPVFIDYITNPSHTIKLAAAKVVALFYQIYNYEEGTENGELNENGILERIPYIDHNELEFTLKEQISESSKRIGKKDKRERKSLFRDVLSTVEAFTSSESRAALTVDELLITHLKLSRSKSLSIDSWYKLLLIQHYKWAYGPSIHTQIANNPFVKETVHDSSYAGIANSYSYSDSVIPAVETTEAQSHIAQQLEKSEFRAQQERATLDRQRQINANRWEKQFNQGTIPTN